MRRRLTLSPRAYARITAITLVALGVIVLTGAGVRLTGSGLGCPDWPKCFGSVVAPLKTHAVIEYGNRLVSGIVGLIAVGAFVASFLRRPRRRGLVWLSALLPLGIVAQAVLGGVTVTHKLAPGYVMAHFGLSMLVLVAAFALFWRARYEPHERPRSHDRLITWLTRALLPVGAIAIFAGTAATAAGPHAGAAGTGEKVHRLTFKGADTLDWVIHQHAFVAALLGLLALGSTILAWRRANIDRQLRDAVTVVTLLMATQGLVGETQYTLKLPTEIVWVHVGLATATWIAILWAVAAAGRLAPRVPAGALDDELDADRALSPPVPAADPR
ncbi:MAG TPA: COX15/CtaA family protein [Solirubrobacteraceae bacterium]|nr:COX15/CtaA family protein [Solirubrobacteraceae bacterium]